ncbi:hypothetical protein F7725_009077 [Dissostichus mawsoni]|uniref:Lactate/malate dehydrogenase C-terminal domain-containing protein n=1 Tax=Dissostichus mawsoni TaxID=36200 RepID=A0A7J5ZA70_DISMA|nr:hypothetical protein F7725_009077 [Dissostichus mawsoni]
MWPRHELICLNVGVYLEVSSNTSDGEPQLFRRSIKGEVHFVSFGASDWFSSGSEDSARGEERGSFSARTSLASYTDSNKRYTHSFLATDAIWDAMAKFVLAEYKTYNCYTCYLFRQNRLPTLCQSRTISRQSTEMSAKLQDPQDLSPSTCMEGMARGHLHKKWLETRAVPFGLEGAGGPRGKAMLLGGFSEFLEHCQDYYSITSDMPTDIMLSVASENLETKMNSIVEEQHRVSLIKPLHIWLSRLGISSALSPTGHFLIPNLLSAEVFPNTSAISLHLLNLEGKEEQLQWLRMETENLALPLLYQVTIHTDLEQAFKEADVILLQDECWSDDSDTEDEEMKKKVKRISDRYREYGQLIDTRANREVKVIVSGDSFVNLRCSLLLDNVNLIDSNQFVTVATQLENEARAIIARKLKVRTSDVTHVIVWGNISGSFYIDLQRAKVFNYDGPIKGPAYFSQPAKHILQERKWLETDFQELVRCQRAAVASKTCRAAPMSLANGILEVLKAWNGICGDYNLPDGIVLSVPVIFTDRKWSVLSDVTREDNLKERLEIAASELRQATSERPIMTECFCQKSNLGDLGGEDKVQPLVILLQFTLVQKLKVLFFGGNQCVVWDVLAGAAFRRFVQDLAGPYCSDLGGGSLQRARGGFSGEELSQGGVLAGAQQGRQSVLHHGGDGRAHYLLAQCLQRLLCILGNRIFLPVSRLSPRCLPSLAPGWYTMAVEVRVHKVERRSKVLDEEADGAQQLHLWRSTGLGSVSLTAAPQREVELHGRELLH